MDLTDYLPYVRITYSKEGSPEIKRIPLCAFSFSLQDLVKGVEEEDKIIIASYNRWAATVAPSNSKLKEMVEHGRSQGYNIRYICS